MIQTMLALTVIHLWTLLLEAVAADLERGAAWVRSWIPALSKDRVNWALSYVPWPL
jgi:hypothetical protein